MESFNSSLNNAHANTKSKYENQSCIQVKTDGTKSDYYCKEIYCQAIILVKQMHSHIYYFLKFCLKLKLSF